MNSQELWKKYEEKMFIQSAYRLVLGTTSFDAETIAPHKGDAYRNERVAYLEGELFSLQTDPEFLALVEELSKRDDLSFQQKRIIKWQLADMERFRYVPKDIFVEYARLSMESSQMWKKAKEAKDYSMFKPYLLKTIEMSKKLLEYRHSDLKGYDILLDDFEPGMTVEKYDAFFDLIKKEIVPLVAAVVKKEKIDDRFVYLNYPAEQQRKLTDKILEYMHYDRDAGAVAETEHPFSDALSKYDSRVTTHYYENNLMSSIFSIIHETGHATYNAQIRDDIAETYCFDNISSGMHESQSRLMENYLGRTRGFWVNLFDDVKELFPKQLENVDLEGFVRAANASFPSLIRTEADELTYPLHILIRYELEKGIFDGTVDVEKLDQLWADKYEEYLGVRPANDAEGILQDVHWSGGSFGYFPTYALGSGYAAQFMHAMAEDLDPEKCMEDNEFPKIKDWLREHIHQYGGLYSPAEIMVMATGEPFDPHYYVEYLKNKYSKLYEL
ncbi:MAG: carboxypeptidase M32 [Erysipelotrichaceae bacterium]|nr:carboxypeptidase M32 [Erysipelotrichaceae bacterium]